MGWPISRGVGSILLLLALASRGVDSDSCSSNILDCNNCENPDLVCVSCSDRSYYRECSSYNRQSCLECPVNCAQCYDDGSDSRGNDVICENCDVGYRLANDMKGCIPCVDGCAECEDTAINDNPQIIEYCDEDKCKMGYSYKSDKTCDKCSDYCTKCEEEGPGKCDKDSTGDYCWPTVYFQANSKTCKACPSHCSDCSQATSSNKCVSGNCEDGYVFVNSGQCQACGSNCLKCDTNGANKCDSGHCHPEYAFVTSSKTCKACADYCHSCNTEGNAECDDGQCYDGYGIKSSNQKCEQCASYCNKCKDQGAGGCDQDECRQGYVWKDTGSGTSCISCPLKCTECDLTEDENNQETETCRVCGDGYILTSDITTCDQCPENCDYCTINGGVTYCTSTGCSSGYCHYGGRCYQCPDFCTRCHSSGANTMCYPDSCMDGYAFRESDHTCVVCPAGCDQCFVKIDNTVICTLCEDRYAVSIDRTQCQRCPDNCEQCRVGEDGAITCWDQQCIPGLTLDDSGSCTDCPSGCDECIYVDGDTICVLDGCEPGWVQSPNVDYTCRDCSNCLTCVWDENYSGDTKCTECKEGYVADPEDLTCHSCPTGCMSCDWDGGDKTCNVIGNTVQCWDNYVGIVDTLCLACPIGCATCTLSGNDARCSSCASRYASVSGGQKCYPCPENCNSCTYKSDDARTECNTNGCAGGYTDENGLCEKCASHCDNCDSQGKDKCDDNGCASGYRTSSDNRDCEKRKKYRLDLR